MKFLTFVKHLLIPHHGNDFKPHLFREIVVFGIIFIIILLLGISFGSSFFIHKTSSGSNVASSVLIDLTNESRIKNGEEPLRKNEKLEKAATLKGNDMVSRSYFAHESPDGITPWHWFDLAGYSFLYAGENLAINFHDSSDVEEAWLNSPKHRANILNGAFREIGIAVVPGMYNTYETLYVVQLFGTPAYGEIAKGAMEGMLTTEERKIAGGTAIAHNIRALGDYEITPPHTIYSSWYERFTFNTSQYIDIFYKFLTTFIGLGLILMIVIEIRKQHLKHIIYGISLLVLLQLFIYINQSFF